MPYISGRRPECNTGRPHPRARRERSIARRRRADRGPRYRLGRTRSRAMVAEPCEVGPVGVEYLVRAARVTDIDRVVALSDDVGADRPRRQPARGGRSHAPAGLPAAGQHRRRGSRGASSSVARSSRSDRPFEPAGTSARSTSWSSTRSTTPIGSPRRSSRSCSGRPATRAAPSSRPNGPTTTRRFARWQRMGFGEAGPRIQRTVAAAGAAARRTT